jgi:hypothetical protein
LGSLPTAGNVVANAMLRLFNFSGGNAAIECAFYDGVGSGSTLRGFGSGESSNLRTIVGTASTDILVTVPLTHRWAVPAGERTVAVRCHSDVANTQVMVRSLTGVVTD